MALRSILSLTVCLGVLSGPAHAGVACKNDQGSEVDWSVKLNMNKMHTINSELNINQNTCQSILSLVCLGARSGPAHANVACRNDKGAEVDWYILYKLPKSTGDGLSYLYMDQSTNGWRVSRKKIDSASGSVGNTLQPLFDYYKKKTEGFGYILYSDQPPKILKTASASFGHSKGLVMLNKTTGVWMSHSTPRFPSYRTDHFWPESGTQNAQTFLCVTYPYREFKNIGVQLKYIRAYPYDYDLPQYFDEELKCVAQKSCYPKSKPWFSVVELTSLKGRQFKSFAKYSKFQKDLYAGLIVNSIEEELYVKSWGRLRKPLPSNCNEAIPHFVYNVKKINPHGKGPFKDTVDHSKWCVTPSGTFTCVADMNRAVSQMGRGGGAVCTSDPTVGAAFYTAVLEPQPCATTSSKRRPITRKISQRSCQ